MIKKRIKLDDRGLPVDGKDWLYEDWKDINECLEEAYRRIRERHKLKERPDDET